MAQATQEYKIVFLKGEWIVDAWFFEGTEEQAISTGKRALMYNGGNGFRVEKYDNPDIVYYRMEVAR